MLGLLLSRFAICGGWHGPQRAGDTRLGRG